MESATADPTWRATWRVAPATPAISGGTVVIIPTFYLLACALMIRWRGGHTTAVKTPIIPADPMI